MRRTFLVNYLLNWEIIYNEIQRIEPLKVDRSTLGVLYPLLLLLSCFSHV